MTGWTTVPSETVAAPLLAESPAHLECEVRQVIDLGGEAHVFSAVHFVIAEVIWVTLDETVCSGDHRVDPVALGTVGRLGLPWFVCSVPEALFDLERKAYTVYAAEQAAADGAR